MSNTMKWVIGLGAAYFYLSTRTPGYTLGANGVYQPSTILDSLTMMLTGAQPPAPVPQQNVSLSIPTPAGSIAMSYTN